MKGNKGNLFIFAIHILAILSQIKCKAIPNFHLGISMDALSISEPAPSAHLTPGTTSGWSYWRGPNEQDSSMKFSSRGVATSTRMMKSQSSKLNRRFRTALKNHPHPVEMAHLMQGDIMGVEGKFERGQNGGRRHFVMNLWPEGVVPYTLSPDFGSENQSLILKAMTEFHENTCIRFIPRTNQKSYIQIEAEDDGCWSSIGRVESEPQKLNLQRNGCLDLATIIHELMHAIGFHHEQTRPDRDRYVTLHRKNIIPGEESQFSKLTSSSFNDLGIPYDTGSVMQYEEDYYSRNGRPTLTAKDNSKLGNTKGFSQSDIKEINILYQCPRSSQGTN